MTALVSADTCLLRRYETLELAMLYALFTGTWFGLGWVLTRRLTDSSIVRTDQSVSEWFVKQRPRLNSLSLVGAILFRHVVKIAASAIVAAVILIVWERWPEPLMVVVVALILEALFRHA